MKQLSLNKTLQLIYGGVCMLIVSGCTTIAPRNPLPEQYSETAEIPGIPDARFYGDEMASFWVDKIDAISEDDVEHEFIGIKNQKHYYLAISGGGERGAFGAGILCGWSQLGTRPEFTLVTGISTGAIIAPFAFLGSEYDEQLKEAFTTVSTADLAQRKSIFNIIAGDSIISTELLLAHIQQEIGQEMVDAIGVEYRKGRRLFVGTFNMDAGRSVIWDMGKIAISDHPDALAIFQRVILASTSIPGAFPPVRFEVEAGGELYDELHADGGVATQVFLYPSALNWHNVEKLLNIKGKPEVYVIRNSFLMPEWKTVKQRMFNLVNRSLNSLIRTQGLGDLNTIFLLSLRDETDFNLTYIPASFDMESKEQFDKAYMSALFQVGFEMGKSDSNWNKTPPGFEAMAEWDKLGIIAQ